jgi:hypothetical protein
MGRFIMNGLTMGGAGLVLLGLVGFAIPIFTTRQTKDVAKIGDLKPQSTKSTSHVIPPILSGGALVLGTVLIGARFLSEALKATRPPQWRKARRRNALRFATAIIVGLMAFVPITSQAFPIGSNMKAENNPNVFEAGPRCGPHAHYVRGHRNRAGYYVRGHCVRNYH